MQFIKITKRNLIYRLLLLRNESWRHNLLPPEALAPRLVVYVVAMRSFGLSDSILSRVNFRDICSHSLHRNIIILLFDINISDHKLFLNTAHRARIFHTGKI